MLRFAVLMCIFSPISLKTLTKYIVLERKNRVQINNIVHKIIFYDMKNTITFDVSKDIFEVLQRGKLMKMTF